MRLVFALAILFVLIPLSARAAGENCIEIANDLDRLACYDRELGRTPKIANIAQVNRNWKSYTETSKLTDKTNVYLSVKSKEIVNCGWNKGDRITLSIRCLENTTSLIFLTGCHMTSSQYSDYGQVTYRIGSAKAKKQGFTQSTNNKALGLWSGGRSIPVIKSMFGKSSLLVQMTPYSENPFTATFDITGLDDAVVPLRKACSW